MSYILYQISYLEYKIYFIGYKICVQIPNTHTAFASTMVVTFGSA